MTAALQRVCGSVTNCECCEKICAIVKSFLTNQPQRRVFILLKAQFVTGKVRLYTKFLGDYKVEPLPYG